MQLAERRLFDCLQSILIFLCRILPFCARAKMSLSRAKNIFMPANINSIVIFEKLILASAICGTQNRTGTDRLGSQSHAS